MVNLIPIGTIGTTSTENFQQAATQPVSGTVADLGEGLATGAGQVAGSTLGGFGRGLISSPVGALIAFLVALFMAGQLFDLQVG